MCARKYTSKQPGRHTGLPLRQKTIRQKNTRTNKCRGAPMCVHKNTDKERKQSPHPGREKSTRTRKSTTCSSSSKRGRHGATVPFATTEHLCSPRSAFGLPLAVEEMRKHKQRKSNSLPLRVLPLYYKKEGEFKENNSNEL